MSAESTWTRPLLMPQNRKLRHLRGIWLRNLTFSRPRGRTIDDAQLNKATKAKLDALRDSQSHSLHHTHSSENLRPVPGRRRSTNLANASPITRQKRIEDTLENKLADAFFSLHVEGEDEPLYVSEVAERATNFNFRLFELGELDSPITRSPTLIIKVWTKRHETWSLLLEDDVDLRALNWLGTLQNVHFPQNSLVFHMIDGIYSIELSNKYPAPTKQPAPLPTSSYNTLMRLATLDNSVQDAIATRDALAQQINELLERETKNELPAEQDRAAYANRCLAQQRRAVDAARKKNDELRASIAARKAAIAEGRALQKRAETDVENAAEKLTHSKESVARTKDQIRGQRRRICEDLSRIFSIVPVPNPSGGPPAPLSFQICGTPLPNTTYDPTALKSSDEDQLSAALGHVAQLTHNLQYYLSAPLPYQIHPYGSRSSIRDDISQLPETQREFPLYVPRGGSSAQYRFDYGWFLLNKDIEALCVSQGLKVVDIRHTLPNLKYLLYVCSAGTEELPERKRGGVRGLWAGRMRSFGIPSVDGNNDAASSLGGGSRRGSDASDATAAGKHHREELQRKAVGLPPANGVANSPTPVIKVSTEGGESVSGIGAGAGGESASASLANLNLPFGKYETKLTLRTKGLRESAAR